MTHLNQLLIIAVSYLVIATNVTATPEDRTLLIGGKGDSMTLDANTGNNLFTGNVTISQGHLSIFADTVRIQRNTSDNSIIDYIKAEGLPAHFNDTPTENGQVITVEGLVIEFFPMENKIITTGNAIIHQAGNKASGARIEYDTVTGIMKISSERVIGKTENGKQAEFILQPGANN